ncbi:unnamed protein product [Linum tenue]|uniref:Uncharacterized protein n=1 Tax=Linum tenue TaxID=586396 RepID=A0AAV0LLR7_9ROSI|nr:unnamed protein product [Linum tenue]
MAAISNSLVVSRNPQLPNLSSGVAPTVLSFNPTRPRNLRVGPSRRSLVVQAAYSDGERSGSGSSGIFIGGFVLGGLIVGALGCVYAPQISKALAGTDRKDLMRKLPKFIYDEEKALEKTRKILSEKIAQLNSAIDDVSSQLRSEDAPEEDMSVNPDEIEAAL